LLRCNYSYSIVTVLTTDKTTTQKDTIEPHVGQADADKVEAGRRELAEAIDDMQFEESYWKMIKCILICLAVFSVMMLMTNIVLVAAGFINPS